MNVEELRARWRQIHGALPPKVLSKDLITRALCYKVQETVLGGLSQEALRTLRLVTTSGAEPQRKIKIGSVLVRELGGALHEVVVVPGGFLWQGGTYDSLSTIAKEITGTNWNGPRFFGLRDKREVVDEANAAPAAILKTKCATRPKHRAGRPSSVGTYDRVGDRSMKTAVPKRQRCAIYTRKSTEHNLDLAFNLLDAQRESCEAYIKSQAHEGWSLIPADYDDGGLSGASAPRSSRSA
jgi:hypothetical protein